MDALVCKVNFIFQLSSSFTTTNQYSACITADEVQILTLAPVCHSSWTRIQRYLNSFLEAKIYPWHGGSTPFFQVNGFRYRGLTIIPAASHSASIHSSMPWRSGLKEPQGLHLCYLLQRWGFQARILLSPTTPPDHFHENHREIGDKGLSWQSLTHTKS